MLVLGVFVIPMLLYAAILVVAASSIPPDRRAVFSAAPVTGAEGIFLASALVLGREDVRRYRSYLDPRTPFGRSEKS